MPALKATARVGRPRPHVYVRNPELTPQEVAVMWLVAEGLGNKAIADKLKISDHTAKFHVCNACMKLGYRTRTGAATRFVLARVAEARERFETVSASG